MRIIPSVVVHKSCSVRHSGNLVAIVPPGHDPCIFIGVLPEPVVGLTEVVKNIASPSSKSRHKIRIQTRISSLEYNVLLAKKNFVKNTRFDPLLVLLWMQKNWNTILDFVKQMLDQKTFVWMCERAMTGYVILKSVKLDWPVGSVRCQNDWRWWVCVWRDPGAVDGEHHEHHHHGNDHNGPDVDAEAVVTLKHAQIKEKMKMFQELNFEVPN